ncbi:MAG: MerR family transcriptional regulator [Bacteroidales bacterium]|nr:MerR family transcriptional regulator [Bacteroidales bacterium]
MPEKLYYKIGEVAGLFKVNTSLIRYWEQEFDFIRPKKSEKGTRYYKRKDIDNFQIVYHLIKEKGLTIQGAKDYLQNKKENKEISKLEVINTLKRTKSLLEEIKKNLEMRSRSIETSGEDI